MPQEKHWNLFFRRKAGCEEGDVVDKAEEWGEAEEEEEEEEACSQDACSRHRWAPVTTSAIAVHER